MVYKMSVALFLQVYTVSQESLYIIVFNVPVINVEQELATLLNNASTLDRLVKTTSAAIWCSFVPLLPDIHVVTITITITYNYVKAYC